MHGKKYAIVDLEATQNDYNRRIIEIGIIILEEVNKEIKFKESYTSLVNPEREVSAAICDLTGITNQELKQAPFFYQMAEEINEMTKDCLFVAHGVDFDFNLLSEELEKLGISFQRKTACTLKLSKHQYPSLPKHDLKSLANFFSIALPFQHRALDDAFVSAELFFRFLQSRKEKKSFTEQVLFKVHRLHPKVSMKSIATMKEGPGIIHFSKNNQIIFSKVVSNAHEESLRALLWISAEYNISVEKVTFRETKEKIEAILYWHRFMQSSLPSLNKYIEAERWGVFLQKRAFWSLKESPLIKGKGFLLKIFNSKKDSKQWIQEIISQIPKNKYAFRDPNDLESTQKEDKKERQRKLKELVSQYSDYPLEHFLLSHYFKEGLREYSFRNNRLTQSIYTTEGQKKIKNLFETPIMRYHLIQFIKEERSKKANSFQVQALKKRIVHNAHSLSK